MIAATRSGGIISDWRGVKLGKVCATMILE